MNSSIAVAAGTAMCAVAMLRATGQRPRISPHETTSAVIDGTRLTIEYGRPSMRGRTIFGALVPYDRVWCPGADEATVLNSARPLRFGALRVPAGPHTIWMLPTADRWTLVVSAEPSGFHTQYHETADLGRVALTKRAIDPPVEQLTFAIGQNRPGSGWTITMTWEKIAVSATFTVEPLALRGAREMRGPFRPSAAPLSHSTFAVRVMEAAPERKRAPTGSRSRG